MLLKPTCARARRLLLESEGGLLSPADGLWLEDHLGRCPTCHAEGRDLARLLGAWREQPAPPYRSVHRDRLEAALQAAPVVVTEPTVPLPLLEERWGWQWAAAAAAAVLVAGVVGALAWPRGTTAPTLPDVAPRVTAAPVRPLLEVLGYRARPAVVGASAPDAVAVAWGRAIAVPVGGTLRLRIAPVGARLGLGGGTRLQLDPQERGVRLELHEGSLAVDVPPHSGWQWAVGLGPKAEVRVVGTRFLVRRDPGGAITVQVTRGRVSYRYGPSGAPEALHLGVGQRLTHSPGAAPVITAPQADPTAALLDEPLPALAPVRVRPTIPVLPGEPAARPGGARPGPAGPDCRPVTLRALRSPLATPALLSRLGACRRAGRMGRELAVLEAETLLQVGQTAQAAARYQAIARGYRGSLAAQNALLAAAQILRYRLGRRADADRLARQYLRDYPRGIHRDEMTRLLR